MRKHAKKILSWILVLTLMTANLCGLAEATLDLPQKLNVIEAEAFMNADSLDEVTVPDGTSEIHARAFANSSLSVITLPESVDFIAADAFSGCDGMMAWVHENSYAHAYCVDMGIDYDLLEPAYSVSALEYDGVFVRATLTTPGACGLLVEILSDSGDRLLHQVTCDISGAMDYETISVSLPSSLSLPDYFVLRATLVDASGAALSSTFTTKQYTQAYESFEALTPEDFSDDIVMDYGDSGFGVVADGATRISGSTITSDYTTFVIPTDAAPAAGDVVVVTLEDGTETPVKVETAVKNADGTCTITRDEDAVLSELYKVFRLDATGDVGAAAQNNGVTTMRSGNGGGSVSISTGFTSGPLSVTVTGTAGVNIKAFYNAEIFGEDYIEQQLTVDLTATAKATLTAACKSSKLKDAFGNPVIPEFTLYKGPISLIGAGATVTAIELDISFPLEFGFDGAAEFSMTISQKSGYSYTSTNGTTKINERDTDYGFDVSAGFFIQIGPKIKVEAIVLFGILTGGVSAQVGLRVDGRAKPVTQSGTGAREHACKLCCDLKFSLFADAKANITLKVSKKYTANLLNVTLFSVKADLGKGYLSLINDADSLFGGKPAMGEGSCPNYHYRTRISTLNEAGAAVTGIPVTITGNGIDPVAGNSLLTHYLYNGSYVAMADFGGNKVSKSFTVHNDEVNLALCAFTMDFTGVVTDEETGDPISGATVEMTPSGLDPVSAVTDADGCYSLTDLPGTTFGLYVYADGYEDYIGGVDYVGTPASAQTMDFALTPEPTASDIFGYVTNSDTAYPVPNATVYILAEDGETYSGVTDDDGFYYIEEVPGTSFDFCIYAADFISKSYLLTIKKPVSGLQEDIILVPDVADPNGVPFAMAQAKLFSDATESSGAVFSSGVMFEMGYTGLSSTGGMGEVAYNLKGKYSSFSFDLGYHESTERDATITVTADGRTLLDRAKIAHDDGVRNFSFSVAGVHQLVIRMESDGYDKARYAMGNISLSPRATTPEPTRASMLDYASLVTDSKNAEMRNDYFNMGGYTYQGGYIITMGYNCGYTGHVTFNLDGNYSNLSFDVAKYFQRFPEAYIRSALLTIEVDGSVVSGFSKKELKWTDITLPISLNVSGASTVKVTIHSDGYDKVKWGVGNIQAY